MKLKFALIFVVAVALTSCGGTVVRFDQTCMTCITSQRLSCNGTDCPASFMVGSDCFVTIVETGENVHLNKILELEKISVREGIPFTLAKVNGSYYVIGEGFKNMWIVSPSGRNEATLDFVKLPEVNIGIPVFELYNKQLKMRGKSNEYNYLYEDVSKKWINQNSAKAGE